MFVALFYKPIEDVKDDIASAIGMFNNDFMALTEMEIRTDKRVIDAINSEKLGGLVGEIPHEHFVNNTFIINHAYYKNEDEIILCEKALNKIIELEKKIEYFNKYYLIDDLTMLKDCLQESCVPCTLYLPCKICKVVCDCENMRICHKCDGHICEKCEDECKDDIIIRCHTCKSKMCAECIDNHKSACLEKEKKKKKKKKKKEK